MTRDEVRKAILQTELAMNHYVNTENVYEALMFLFRTRLENLEEINKLIDIREAK